MTGRSLILTESARVRRCPVAVVFGAGVRPDGSPSAVLFDRVQAAGRLYAAGIVDSVVLSGDGQGDRGYDEVSVMGQVASQVGIDRSAIIEDREGVSTFATVRRATRELGVTDFVAVTQRFHAPRVAFLARATRTRYQVLALPDRAKYGRRAVLPLELREIVAIPKALVEFGRLRLDRSGSRGDAGPSETSRRRRR